MRVKFGVGTGRNQPIHDIVGHARLAEELGFDHITFIDSQNLSRDVYAMMTIAALETDRIRIGHGVTNPFSRHWVVTANATATVHELTGGRAFVGIGPGMSSVGTLGMKPRPMSEFREAVLRMRALTNGEDVVVDGHAIRSEWIRGGVPIFLGSDGPRSMFMAGQIGDGVICPSVDPEIFRWRLDVIRRGAEEAGRDPDGIEVWSRTMAYVSDSPEEARRETRSYAATCATAFYFSVLKRPTPDADELRRRIDPQLLEDIQRIHDHYDYYEHERTDAPHGDLVTDRVIDAFILAGTADEVVEKVSKLADAGVGTVSLTDYTIIDKQGMMRRVADEVMPHFRD